MFLHSCFKKGVLSFFIGLIIASLGGCGEQSASQPEKVVMLGEAPTGCEDKTDHSGQILFEAVSLVGQPTVQYVPNNAAEIHVGSLVFTAGSSDWTINSLTIDRAGLGSVSGVHSAVAFSDGVQLSPSRTFSTTQQNVGLNMIQPLVMKAGTKRIVDIFVSLSNPGIAGNQHQFVLTSINGVKLNTPVILGIIITTTNQR